MASTDLEERFAREYVVDLDAPAACRRVRPDVSAASARTLACSLLTKVEVQASIAVLVEAACGSAWRRWGFPARRAP